MIEAIPAATITPAQTTPTPPSEPAPAPAGVGSAPSQIASSQVPPTNIFKKAINKLIELFNRFIAKFDWCCKNPTIATAQPSAPPVTVRGVPQGIFREHTQEITDRLFHIRENLRNFVAALPARNPAVTLPNIAPQRAVALIDSDPASFATNRTGRMYLEILLDEFNTTVRFFDELTTAFHPRHTVYQPLSADIFIASRDGNPLQEFYIHLTQRHLFDAVDRIQRATNILYIYLFRAYGVPYHGNIERSPRELPPFDMTNSRQLLTEEAAARYHQALMPHFAHAEQMIATLSQHLTQRLQTPATTT